MTASEVAEQLGKAQHAIDRLAQESKDETLAAALNALLDTIQAVWENAQALMRDHVGGELK